MAVQAVKRLSCVGQDAEIVKWDEPLNPICRVACERLAQEIQERGDPVTGQWQYNANGKWVFVEPSG